MSNTHSAFADSKPHYALLDGLRGVAALLVLWYHVFEGYSFAEGVSTGAFPPITPMNHGYLAVDFFFILSGFVIGYAYDDRWNGRMTMGSFFKRRLIRLHPMVVIGALIGLVMFCMQGCVQWDGTHVGISLMMLAVLLQLFMIPATPGSAGEIRGNGEMFPLNGPCWSLFFEYLGNIFYAVWIRRVSTKVLAAIVVVLGAGLGYFAAVDVPGDGMLGVGWSLGGWGFPGGLLRMLFPYTLGLLMARVFRPVKMRGAFWLCTFVLFCLFCAPCIESSGTLCLNALYDAICIIFVFPVLVWIAASGETTDNASTRICRFLGDISYPLYVVHYPLMYYFYDWMAKSGRYTFADTWAESLAVVAGSVLLAYLTLRVYDLPLRKYLARKFLPVKKTV